MSPASGSLWARLKGGLFHIFPHHAVARVTLRLTRLETPLKDPLIRLFIRLFAVDMREAEEPDPARYASFNAFFVRRLKAEARPVARAPGRIVCPADGRVSQLGTIHTGRILQAKGRDYSLVTLLGGSPQRAAPFQDGHFCTVYLSPRDYHRVHMPTAGRLVEMVHVPGRLFSVAPYAVEVIPGLFTRNERVISVFATAWGPLAVIMVGAVNVAAIETIWHGLVTPPKGRHLQVFDYSDNPAPGELAQGDELGRFNLGSTVIVLFPPVIMEWDAGLQVHSPVKMGSQLGRFR